MKETSTFKKILLEVGFFFGLVLAVIFTAVDIVFGIVRYIIGRLRGKPNFNPWSSLRLLWKMLWLHIVYLFNTLKPSFRESMKRNREAMHRRATVARNMFVTHGNMDALRDFDYVDGVDIATFLLMVPYGVILGAFLFQSIIALVIVASGYGVYKHYQVTAVAPTAPQQQTILKYQPQVADKQETDFGPTWLSRAAVLDKVNQPDFKNIALLSDGGSMKYSATKVADVTGFIELQFTELVVNPTVTTAGQIHFLDQLGQEFVINKEQAFMFEGNATMFMFNSDGKLMALASEAVKTR